MVSEVMAKRGDDARKKKLVYEGKYRLVHFSEYH